MDQLPAAVADEEHHVEDLAADRLDDEEVGRPDAVDVVPKESAPGLATFRTWLPPAIPPDRPVAHDDAELQQLPTDTLCAPKPVVARDLRDEILDFGGKARPSDSPPRLPSPVQPPPLAVPTKHGFWADDEEVPPRGWPETIDPDPQDSITLAESRSRIGAEGNPELVTQDEIFQNEIASRSRANEETADHQ